MAGEIRAEYFLDNWSAEKQEQVLNGTEVDEDSVLFWDKFNAKEHLKQVNDHKGFIVKAFNRFVVLNSLNHKFKFYVVFHSLKIEMYCKNECSLYYHNGNLCSDD